MTPNISEKFVNCLQKLYPGEILTLVEVDGTRFGAQVYRFHNENIQFTQEELLLATSTGSLPEKVIRFNGNEYGGRPFGLSGFTMSSDGTPDKPQLTLSNIDSQVSALIRSYNGMMQAKVTIWIIVRDLLKPDWTVDEGDFRKLVYYIERPNYCDHTRATFDLTSPYDMDGIMIPGRLSQSVCYWAQRGWYKSGKGCMYNGENGYFDKDGNPVSDPSQDFCPGTVNACRLRYKDGELDFGGCAAASLVRRKS